MNHRLAILVLLAAFAIVGAATLVPLAEATCTTGGVYPKCLVSDPRCDPVVMPRCEPYP